MRISLKSLIVLRFLRKIVRFTIVFILFQLFKKKNDASQRVKAPGIWFYIGLVKFNSAEYLQQKESVYYCYIYRKGPIYSASS